MLKQDYQEDKTTLKDALMLAMKVLSKTLDVTKLTPEKRKHVLQSPFPFLYFVWQLILIDRSSCGNFEPKLSSQLCSSLLSGVESM
jgi:hypothetical protein